MNGRPSPQSSIFQKDYLTVCQVYNFIGTPNMKKAGLLLVPKNKLSKKESRHHCHVDILVGQFLVFQQKFYPDKNSCWACHNQMKDMKKGRKYYDYYESKQGHKILL